MTDPKYKRKDGFTLLEVMVATVVVVIVILGGARYTILSAQLIQNQKDARCADVIAAARMEQMLSRPYADYLKDADDLNKHASHEYFFLKYFSGTRTFVAQRTDPGQTVDINNTTADIRMRARVFDTTAVGGAVSAECAELEVLIRYGLDNKRSLCMKNIQTY